MKIKFQKSGGFAGITFKKELDTNNLTPELSNKLQDLLDKVLPFTQEELPSGSDLSTYELSIDDVESKRSLKVNDLSLTDNLNDLFDFLMDQ